MASSSVQYDEDLEDNPLVLALKEDFSLVFEQAVQERWTICVPRRALLTTHMRWEDVAPHILVPSDSRPDTHFRSLCNKVVRLATSAATTTQHVLQIFHDDWSPGIDEDNDDGGGVDADVPTYPILFKETFYDHQMRKYQLLCIEGVFRADGTKVERSDQEGARKSSEGEEEEEDDDPALVHLRTLHDCVDFLRAQEKKWSSPSQTPPTLLAHIERLAVNFARQEEHNYLEERSSLAASLADRVETCYIRCVSGLSKHATGEASPALEAHWRLAVETYLMHCLHSTVFARLAIFTSGEDAVVNKHVLNLVDVRLEDVRVADTFQSVLAKARSEASRIDEFSTPLGKLGCLHRCFHVLSGAVAEGSHMATDDLLPAIIYILIKAKNPNWLAHLRYILDFRLSGKEQLSRDESGFVLATFQAAVEHLRTGQVVVQHLLPQPERATSSPSGTKRAWTGENRLLDVFEEIGRGNVEAVTRMLCQNESATEDAADRGQPEELLSQLCHPLCSCDRCSTLKRTLDRPSVRSCDDRGYTVLHVCSILGKPVLLEAVLSLGSPVDPVDLSGMTPMQHAAAKGHQNVLLLLLYAGADMSAVDDDGNSVLHWAALNGHEQCVKALIYFSEHRSRPLKLSAANARGDTPLHLAARWGYVSIVKLLLEYRAQTDVRNKKKQTPFECAQNAWLAQLIEQHDLKDLDFFSTYYPPPQHRAPVSSERASSSYILEDGDRNNVDDDVDENADLRRVDLLFKAINLGDLRQVNACLGLDDVPSSAASLLAGRSRSPSHLASVDRVCPALCSCEKCMRGQLDALSGLGRLVSTTGGRCGATWALRASACVFDETGLTPLHAAAQQGNADVIRALLSAGARADVAVRGGGGETPLHLACRNGHLSAAELLCGQPEVDVRARDRRGNTPLHLCTPNGDYELVNLLLNRGACSGVKNSTGQTPLLLAADNLALANLLQKHSKKESDQGKCERARGPTHAGYD